MMKITMLNTKTDWMMITAQTGIKPPLVWLRIYLDRWGVIIRWGTRSIRCEWTKSISRIGIIMALLPFSMTTIF